MLANTLSSWKRFVQLKKIQQAALQKVQQSWKAQLMGIALQNWIYPRITQFNAFFDGSVNCSLQKEKPRKWLATYCSSDTSTAYSLAGKRARRIILRVKRKCTIFHTLSHSFSGDWIRFTPTLSERRSLLCSQSGSNVCTKLLTSYFNTLQMLVTPD